MTPDLSEVRRGKGGSKDGIYALLVLPPLPSPQGQLASFLGTSWGYSCMMGPHESQLHSVWTVPREESQAGSEALGQGVSHSASAGSSVMEQETPGLRSRQPAVSH